MGFIRMNMLTCSVRVVFWRGRRVSVWFFLLSPKPWISPVSSLDFHEGEVLDS